MNRKIAVMVVPLVLAVSMPSHAATYTIAMRDPAEFKPKWIASVALGSTFVFDNQGQLTHTTRLSPQAIPWNVTLSSGETWTKTLRYAGTWRYYCDLHASGPNDTGAMIGAIGMPLRVAPTSGSTATIFTIRLGIVDAPSGYVYDVQRKVGTTGSWTAWKTGVKNDTTMFDPSAGGTYSFRSRLRWTSPSPDRAIGWSPGRTVTVG